MPERKSRRMFVIRAIIILSVIVMMPAMTTARAGDRQGEARNMLTLINQFRTGSNAWFWNSDNQTKTVESGLSALAYDYQLEEVARIRAAEIAVSFSHTRPDGRSWSTAFPAGNYYKGENIACGFETVAAAFDGFKEENEDYAGQGHRRNMLRKAFTRVGLAAVEVGDTVYWVQEFASGSVVNAGTQDTQGGWTLINGKYYFRKPDGGFATGWIQDGDQWYYLSADGEMQTGWVQDAGKWYYMNQSGAMQTGWVQSGRKWFYLGKNGVMQTGWVKVSGKWYHLDSSGAMETGWIKDNGKWYYCRSSGEMVTGRTTVDGQAEIFSENGEWLYTELGEYDTPLGMNPLVNMVRTIWFRIENIIKSFITEH